jgi:hypothetical protein
MLLHSLGSVPLRLLFHRYQQAGEVRSHQEERRVPRSRLTSAPALFRCRTHETPGTLAYFTKLVARCLATTVCGVLSHEPRVWGQSQCTAESASALASPPISRAPALGTRQMHTGHKVHSHSKVGGLAAFSSLLAGWFRTGPVIPTCMKDLLMSTSTRSQAPSSNINGSLCMFAKCKGQLAMTWRFPHAENPAPVLHILDWHTLNTIAGRFQGVLWRQQHNVCHVAETRQRSVIRYDFYA